MVLSEELLQKLARSVLAAAERAELGVSISVVDEAGAHRIYVSEAATRLLGYSAEELIGSSTYLAFVPEERERMLELTRQWRTGAAVPFFLESAIVRKDGTRVPIEVAYSLVDLDGTPVTVSFLRDISERKRTEEALKNSEALFRKLVEAAPEAVVVTRGALFAYANPRFLNLVGYDHFDELRDRHASDLIHPLDRTQLDERVDQIRRSAELPSPREYRLLARDGGTISVECSSLPIDFEGGPAVLTFLRDVTERKETQAQLIQTDRMATIGTLAAGVAHELNNPLAYVLLNLGILGRELEQLVPDPESRARLRSRVSTMQEGAERMATIVRDLRSFCRPSSPSPLPVDMRQVLELSINMAMTELKDRARLVRDYAPVPPVVADGARLGQVFLNLLLNAAQALPDEPTGDHEVHIALRMDPDRRLRVEVTDNGCGIPSDIIGRIFEPFFTTKPIGVGTGLGLSICQSIVASMNGELTVDSEVGRGTTFRVLLPLPTASATAPASMPPPATITGSEARVLVIDDEVAIAVALKKVLEEEHDVTAVTAGSRALELLLEGARFDVILCDVLMPSTSGIDVYRELEGKLPELARRIIFMTGASSMPRVAEFFRSISNRRIDKPVDVARLRQLIREVAAAETVA